MTHKQQTSQQTSSWPIFGHELVVARLSKAVLEGHIAHAYLVSGPDQVGKSTLVRIFTQALFCTSQHSRPCGTCRACRLVELNKHPDFLRLDMNWQSVNLPDKSSAKSISVNAVRQMNSELVRRPHEARWKVLVIPDVHDLTLAACNAFLKTLEEPPSFVVIMLTTRDSELVLPTIRSRCQPLLLFPLPHEEVEKVLRIQWGVKQERAKLLAKLSGGCIGWAIQAVEDDSLLKKRQRILATLQKALESNRAERLLAAVPLSKENDLVVMQLWSGWWRDVLLIQHHATEAISNIDQQALLEEAAKRYTTQQVRSFLKELQRLLRLARHTNANRQLLWEVLLLKLPHLNMK